MKIITVDRMTDLVTDDNCRLRCDYNLRTLPLDGNCPECGAALQDSLRRLPSAGFVRWAIRGCFPISAEIPRAPGV